MLFLWSNITKPNKSINKTVVVHAYNNLCIPQMGVGIITMTNKGIAYWCHFCVVPGNWPALLGIPDCERLQLLSINLQTTNDQQMGIQINEQTKQVKSNPCNSSKNNLHTNNSIKQETDYIIAGPSMQGDGVASRKTALKMHNEYSNVFTGIVCFRGPFFFMGQRGCEAISDMAKGCCIWTTWAIQKELESLQEQQILAPLGVDNSFVIVLKPNGTVCQCLDPTRLNQTFIRPVHRGPTINDILPKLTYTCYMIIIDAGSGYHNLKLDKKLLYVTIFACQFGRYSFIRLPFWVVPAGDMFQ